MIERRSLILGVRHFSQNISVLFFLVLFAHLFLEDNNHLIMVVSEDFDLMSGYNGGGKSRSSILGKLEPFFVVDVVCLS